MIVSKRKSWQWTAALVLLVVLTTIISCQTVSSVRKPISSQLSYSAKAKMKLTDIFPDVSLTSQPATGPATSAPADKHEKIVSEAILAYFQAKEAIFQDDTPTAIAQLKKAIELDPSYLPAHELLMTLAFEKNQGELAEAEARKVLELKSDDPMGCYILGSQLLQSNRIDDAMDYLYRASVLWERQGKGTKLECLLATFKLGGSLAGQGYLVATIEVYQPLLTKMEQLDGDVQDPRISRIIEIYKPGLYLLLGEFSFKLKQYPEAMTYFEKAKKIPSVEQQATIGIVRCHVVMGQLEKAKSTLDELAKDNFDDSLIELYQKLYPKTWADKVVQIYLPDSKNISAGLSIAERLITDKKYDLSIELLKNIRAVDPNDSQAVWLMVRAYHLNGKTEQGAELLLNAVTQTPGVGLGISRTYSPADIELGRSLAENLSVLKIEPQKEYARSYLLGLAYQAEFRADQAEDSFRRSLKLRKDFQPAYLALGRLLLRERKWQTAVDLIDQATAQKLKGGGLLYIKGKALSELGQTQASLNTLEQARKLDPNSDRILLALTEEYLRNRQAPKAAEQLKRLISEQLAGPDTLLRLTEMLLEAGTPEMSEAVLRQYDQKFGQDETWQLLNARKRFLNDQDVTKYRKTLAGFPEDSISPGLLAKMKAELEFDVGNFQQAADISRNAIEKNRLMESDDYQRLMQLDALSNWKLLNYDRAEWAWRELIKNWPGERSTTLALTKMFMDAQSFAKAQPLISKLLKSAKNDSEKSQLQIWLVSCQLGQDRLLDALNTIDEWLKNASTEDRTRYLQLKIDCLLQEQQYPEALALLENFIKQKQEPLKKWQQTYVSVLETLNQPKEALEAIRKFESGADKSDRQFYDNLKIPFLLHMKKYDEAIALAKNATAAADANLHFISVLTLLNCYQDAGKFQEALSLAQNEEKKLTSESFITISLRQQIARTLQLAGRNSEAEKYIMDQISRSDDERRSQWQQWLISLYFSANQNNKAIALLEKILDTQPNLAWANNSLGYTLADHNRELARSERLVRKALSDEPGSIAYLDSLAWVMYRQKNYTEAYRFAKMAERGMTDPDPVILDHLGDICLKMKKYDEARAVWQRAIKLCEGRDSSVLEPDMPGRMIKKLNKIVQDTSHK